MRFLVARPRRHGHAAARPRACPTPIRATLKRPETRPGARRRHRRERAAGGRDRQRRMSAAADAGPAAAASRCWSSMPTAGSPTAARGDLARPARARRPGGRQRRRDACRRACSGLHLRDRRAGRGAARRPPLAARRTTSARFTAVVFGAGDCRTRTEDRAAAAAARAPATGSRSGRSCRRVERLLDHPRLVELRFAGDAGRGVGRPRRGTAGRSSTPTCRAARAVGRVDADRRRCRSPSSRRRPASRSTGARSARLRRARHRLRHAHPCGRHLLHRRPCARRAAAVRRAIPHPGRHRAGGRGASGERRDGSSRSGRLWFARWSTPRAGRASCGPARARHRPDRRRHPRCGWSTRSSPASTSRAPATTSCCARSPTTRRWRAWHARWRTRAYRTHEFGDSVLLLRSGRAAMPD